MRYKTQRDFGLVLLEQRLPLLRASVLVAVGGLLLASRPALADNCFDPDQLPCCPTIPLSDPPIPIPQARDFSPWLVAPDEFADEVSSLNCFFSTNGYPDIPVEIDRIADDPDEHDLRDGCNTSRRFDHSILRLGHEQLLAPDSEYQVTCSAMSTGPVLEFVTNSAEASPLPPEVEVTDVAVVRDSCEGTAEIAVEVVGVDDSFFQHGGVLLLEYSPDRVELIHSPAVGHFHGTAPRFRFPLPLEADEVLQLTALNGAGLAGDAVEVDVRHIGSNDRVSRCQAIGSPSGGAGVFCLFVVLIILRRQPVTRCSSP